MGSHPATGGDPPVKAPSGGRLGLLWGRLGAAVLGLLWGCRLGAAVSKGRWNGGTLELEGALER